MKKKFNILFGIGAISMINGALLTLTPVILKDHIHVGSLWFAGIFITLNSLVVNFGSSSTLLNKITNKLDYNKITYTYLIVPFLLMLGLVLTKNIIFLAIYFATFSILGILRNISLANVTMLDKDNKFLVKYRIVIATITSIIGLAGAQFLLDRSIDLFLISVASAIIFAIVVLLTTKTQIPQKKFTKTKPLKSSNYKKIGIYLGISKGLSLILITILNFYIILHTSQYGYIKVFEAIFSICIIYGVSYFIKSHTFSKIITLRGTILLAPLIGILLITCVSDITFTLLLAITFVISICNYSEDILINSIFEKYSKKDINKHVYLFSYYYKTSAVLLLIAVVATYVLDFQNTALIIGLASTISVLIIILLSLFIRRVK